MEGQSYPCQATKLNHDEDHDRVGGGEELCVLHSLHAVFGLCDLLWVPSQVELPYSLF